MVEHDPMGETASVTASDTGAPKRFRRRVLTVAAAAGLAAGAAVGATALAGAATQPTTTQPGSSSTTTPGVHHGIGGRFHPEFAGGMGGFFGGPGGGVVHGQFTIKGPNGYETLDERTGTVSDVSNTSGSDWSLTVKSDDGTSGTFTVDSGSSVNGGESGIASVKTGDTVDVTATVSGGTSTVKSITDETTLKADGKSWMPTPPSMPMGGSGSSSGSSSESATTSAT